MPTLTASALSSLFTRQFAPKIAKQMNRSSVLLSLLEVKPGAGEVVSFGAKFPRSVEPAAIATEGSDVDDAEFQSDVKVDASLPWARYRTGIKLSGLVEDIAASSTGSPEQIMDLFEAELDDAIEALTSKINKDLWGGTGTGRTIAGLIGGGVLAATGSYAGISQATYATWAAYVSANGGTPRPLTKALLDALERELFVRADQPDILVASPDVASLFESLFDATIRTRPVNLGQGRADLSVLALNNVLGDTGLSFKGIPVFRDKDAPAGTFAALNRKHLHIKTLPIIQKKMPDVTTEATRAAQAEGEKYPISVKIQPLAKTGDSRKFQIVATLQLVSQRRNAHGVIRDLG